MAFNKNFTLKHFCKIYFKILVKLNLTWQKSCSIKLLYDIYLVWKVPIFDISTEEDFLNISSFYFILRLFKSDTDCSIFIWYASMWIWTSSYFFPYLDHNWTRVKTVRHGLSSQPYLRRRNWNVPWTCFLILWRNWRKIR